MKHLYYALAAAGAMTILGGCAGGARPAPALAKSEPEQQAHCVRETGSRIEQPDACAPGRVYTRDQVRNTGAISLGDALEQLGI
jgi:hypothetical protein